MVNLNIDWTQEEKETIAKIDAFAGQFTAKIATDEAMHLGMSKALREAIEKNHISQAEIMQAYILTGGKADIGTMSTAEKIGMYISLFSWAIEYAGSMGVGVAEFVNSLVPESIGGKNTMITKMPDDVKEFAEEVMGSERLNSILKGYVKAGFNFMDHFTENATGVTAVAAIALLFTPLFPKRTSIASTLLK